MLFTFTGNGSCESLYGNKCISVENVDAETVQKFIDEWEEKIDDELLDQFNDIIPEKVSISDIVAAMPNEWNAQETDFVCETLFV